MKQNYRTIKTVLLLSAAIAILSLGSSGCSLYLLQDLGEAIGTGGDSGELLVNINSAGVKTLLPPISMSPADYTVSGTDGNGGRNGVHGYHVRGPDEEYPSLDGGGAWVSAMPPGRP